MKFLHTSDLHIGKMLGEWDLIPDTAFVLDQVAGIAEREQVDAVVIAGDVFDRPVPSDRALELYGNFLARLVARDHIPVLAIAGNHDSDTRLAAYSDLLGPTGYTIAGRYTGTIATKTFGDASGEVVFWLLPYFQPVDVKAALKLDAPLGKLTDDQAFAAIMAHANVDPAKRNVLVMHQFVAGYEPAGSEQPGLVFADVAGLSNIAVNRLEPFDYVALGHVHRPERIGRDTIRYSGSLLGYKIQEANQKEKSVTIVDLGPKGEVALKTVPLRPLHPLRLVAGLFADLLKSPRDPDSFVFVKVLDPQPVVQAGRQLGAKFPRYLTIDFPNCREETTVAASKVDENLSPFAFLKAFYQERTGQTMTGQDEELTREILAAIVKEEGQ